MSHRFSHRVRPGFLLALLLLLGAAAFAQDKQHADDSSNRPIFVTTRIFQMKAKRESYPEITSQVFRMKSSSLVSDEKWTNAFAKTYPGMEISLLRTEARRVFRTSKPTILSLVKQPDGRAVEIQMYGAQSPGDGNTPGTSLIPEISLHFGNDQVKKPVTFAIQPLEVETGTTYFFAVPNLRLSSSDYVKFVRPNVPVEPFDGNDIYLVFGFTVDLDKTEQPARYFDERQSPELQAQATRKVQPEVSAALRDAGLGGFIRVRVQIAPDGKVSAANIHTSSFPELNAATLAAARQWEFPASLFAENKTPITAFLTFSLAPPQKNSGGK